MSEFLDDLQARGLVQDSTDLDALAERLDAGPIRLYYGCDPSAPSLHAGNLIGLLVLRRFAEAWKLPVGTAFRRQDHFDNLHACYAGDVGIGANPKLAKRVREADLLLVVGPRLGEMTTGGYSLLGIPEPHGRLVHVHPDPEELGRVYRPSLAVAADPRSFSAAVLSLVPPPEPAWAADTEQAHRDYLDWNQPVESVGPLQMAGLVDWLAKTLPSDSIICNGAGRIERNDVLLGLGALALEHRLKDAGVVLELSAA